jgi:hypothetical protein
MRIVSNLLAGLALFILGAALGSVGMLTYTHCSDELVRIYRHHFDELVRLVHPTPAPRRKVLYYGDPSGAPYWSATPKKDASGRDYVPVYEDEENLDLRAESATPPSNN